MVTSGQMITQSPSSDRLSDRLSTLSVTETEIVFCITAASNHGPNHGNVIHSTVTGDPPSPLSPPLPSVYQNPTSSPLTASTLPYLFSLCYVCYKSLLFERQRQQVD